MSNRSLYAPQLRVSLDELVRTELDLEAGVAFEVYADDVGTWSWRIRRFVQEARPLITSLWWVAATVCMMRNDESVGIGLFIVSCVLAAVFGAVAGHMMHEPAQKRLLPDVRFLLNVPGHPSLAEALDQGMSAEEAYRLTKLSIAKQLRLRERVEDVTLRVEADKSTVSPAVSVRLRQHVG